MKEINHALESFSESEIINILVSTTPVAYIILDKDFRIHFINDYFLELRKLSKDDTMGEKCYNLSNGGVRCSICAVGAAIETGQKCRVLRKDKLKDGTIRYIDDYAIPLYKNGSTEFDYILEIMVNRDAQMRHLKQMEDDFYDIIGVLTSLLEAKDSYTATHSSMVRKLSMQIATAMGLSHDEVRDIGVAASLHDIGKVYIPDEIINKPGRLTDEEFSLIKTHPQKSYEMLMHLSGFMGSKNIARYHHERYDGKGYPLGLAEEQIPLAARIVAVADTYDAMTSTRSYRKALSHETAVEEIRRCAGTQFDPIVVYAFLRSENALPSDSTDDKDTKEAGYERNIHAKKEQDTDNRTFKQLGDIVSEHEFIEAIFANTPVAYIISDEHHNIIYASAYLLSLFHTTADEVIGKTCCFFNTDGKSCAVCHANIAMTEDRVEFYKAVKLSNAGEKHLDVFAVPLKTNDGNKYVIQIILDRTDETLMQERHENDMKSIIDMMSQVLSETDINLDDKTKKLIKEKTEQFSRTFDM